MCFYCHYHVLASFIIMMMMMMMVIVCFNFCFLFYMVFSVFVSKMHQKPGVLAFRLGELQPGSFRENSPEGSNSPRSRKKDTGNPKVASLPQKQTIKNMLQNRSIPCKQPWPRHDVDGRTYVQPQTCWRTTKPQNHTTNHAKSLQKQKVSIHQSDG